MSPSINGGSHEANSQTQVFFLPKDGRPDFKTGRWAKIDGWHQALHLRRMRSGSKLHHAGKSTAERGSQALAAAKSEGNLAAAFPERQ
jgi:hypothetical protein